MKLFKNFGKKTLFYPGCMLKFAMQKEMEAYKSILNHLGIDFVMLPDKEVCCGSPVYNAGYKKEARELAEKNLKLLKDRKIIRIITPCPGCFNMFENEYPKISRDWANSEIKVEHLTKVILKALKRKGIRSHELENEKEIVTYHDPCHLGRFCDIYEEPRKVIELLGGKIKEMKHNREDALCCGAGGGLRANYPKLSKNIAVKRTDEIPKDVESVITPCGLCTANLKTADERTVEWGAWVWSRLRRLKG